MNCSRVPGKLILGQATGGAADFAQARLQGDGLGTTRGAAPAEVSKAFDLVAAFIFGVCDQGIDLGDELLDARDGRRDGVVWDEDAHLFGASDFGFDSFVHFDFVMVNAMTRTAEVEVHGRRFQAGGGGWLLVDVPKGRHLAVPGSTPAIH
jgi:hypothetical protein